MVQKLRMLKCTLKGFKEWHWQLAVGGGDELDPQLPSERLAFGSGAGGADDWLSLATVVWGSFSPSHGISAGLVYPSVLACLVSELP